MSNAARQVRDALLIVIAAAALLVAGTLGHALAADPTPSSSSAEAGFARDMRTHHLQAVRMSEIARDASTDPEIRYLALDIATGQQAQAGMMSGWLDLWGLTQTDDDQEQMAWMSGAHGEGHGDQHAGLLPDGRMPGMATAADIERLGTLKGRDAEVLWLTLMVAHHRGGVEMARAAVPLVDEPYERNLAEHIVDSQTSEIEYMNRLLAERGAPPA
jgi:uncharacterized protein (DUF305 family)